HGSECACDRNGEPVGRWYRPANAANAEDAGALPAITELEPVATVYITHQADRIVQPFGIDLEFSVLEEGFLRGDVVVLIHRGNEPMRAEGQFHQTRGPTSLIPGRTEVLQFK